MEKTLHADHLPPELDRTHGLNNACCVINVGIVVPEKIQEAECGTPGFRRRKWCRAGTRRLKASFRRFNPNYHFLTWSDQLPEGSHPHLEVPYHFKIRAFEIARSMGYWKVLWCDSAIWAQHDPFSIFQDIQNVGWYIAPNYGGSCEDPWTTGHWCADSALAPLQITREESWSIPKISANALGLNLLNPTAQQFLKEWGDCAEKAFPGPWSNDHGEASSNRRVLGHRHDQTAAGVICHRLGMGLDRQNRRTDWTPDLYFTRHVTLICQRDFMGDMHQWKRPVLP